MKENFVILQQKELKMGLGEAITRLNLLHSKKGRGIASEEEKTEHSLILDALNEIKIDLGFDCNDDGVPDTVEIFSKSAATGCCRLLPSTQTSGRRKTSSRR